MNDTNFLRFFRDEILSKKVLVCLAVFTAILCFGFTVTHFSIGLDDMANEHYLYTNGRGSQIQQGRLLHHVLNLLTGTVEFIPFFNDFLGAALFCLSALLFTGLFHYVAGGHLSTAALTAFCCVYISHPIINEKFIHNLDVTATMLSYCSTALALVYAHMFTTKKKPRFFWKAVAALAVALGSYESFIFVYICGVFAVFILRILVNGEQMRFRQLLKDGLRSAAVLLMAMLIYYGIVTLVQLATGQYGMYERANAWTNREAGILTTFLNITKTIGQQLCQPKVVSIRVFAIFSMLGFALFTDLAIRKRSGCLLLCYCGLFAGNLVIHYICGYIMYRAALTFCLFIGFLVLVILQRVDPVPAIKKGVIFLAVLLVLVQSADMNRWFYNDYSRYQKEKFVIDTVATRLVSEFDTSKPVIFLTDAGKLYLNTDIYGGGQINGLSVMYWSVGTFSIHTSPLMHKLFRFHGYTFLMEPTLEQVKRAREESVDMEGWPKAGCIQEFDEYIVVKIEKVWG